MSGFSGPEVVEQFWPYDGVNEPELTVQAAAAAATLVRYLNNKTGRSGSLPYASDVHRLVSALASTCGRLDQLLAQLATATGSVGQASGVYDDRGADWAPADTARAAAEALTAARRSLGQAASALNEASELTSHLGGPTQPERGDGGEW